MEQNTTNQKVTNKEKSIIKKMLKKNGLSQLPIKVRKSEYDFDDRIDGYEAPFKCNQFWDIKQVHLLLIRILQKFTSRLIDASSEKSGDC